MILSILQHECQNRVTRLHSCILHSRVRHQCDTGATRVRYEQHESNTNNTITTRVDNDSSQNILSPSYISYMASERLEGEE